MKLVNLSLSLVIILFLSLSIKAEENYIKFNYGISNNEVSTTSTVGTIPTDESDQGFLLSAGTMIGDNWGAELMYYDLGSSSITMDAAEMITIDNVNYEAQSAGTISNSISGYGVGLILANNENLMNFYVKAGFHSWDKSGSTTILDNDNGFSGSFYNQGIGAYGGLGISINVLDNTSIDLAYDIIGLSNNASLENNSSLLSAGIKLSF